MMHVEEAEGLGDQSVLSRWELRNELQRFASMELQYELVKACTHLREELLKQLQELCLAGKGELPPLRGSLCTAGNSVMSPAKFPEEKPPEPPDVGHGPLPLPPERSPFNMAGGELTSLPGLPRENRRAPRSGSSEDLQAMKKVRSTVSFADPPQELVLERKATEGALKRCHESMYSTLSEPSEGARVTRLSFRQTVQTEIRESELQTEQSSATQAWGNNLSLPSGIIKKKNKPQRDARAIKPSAMAMKLSWHRKKQQEALARQKSGEKTVLPEVIWQMRKKMLEYCFENGISVAIILNGIFIGVQTDYQARHVTEEIPVGYVIIEIIFCVLFTAELIMKLLLHRLSFYFMSGWMWNIFDTLLVLVQLVEVVGLITADFKQTQSSTGGLNLGFVRLLRILRVLRILRLFRLLQFIDELAVIVNSIAHVFRSLCSTLALLCMMIYMVGIVCAQVVFTYRVGLEEDPRDLEKYFGSLSLTFLSLYQSILGGVDWENLTDLMKDISPFFVLFFCMYIAFAMMAVMNVITGTFVQSAVRDADKDKVKDFSEAARRAFAVESEDYVTYGRFEHAVDDTNFAVWLENMQIKSADAKLLFHIMDNGAGSKGYVDIKNMIDGLVRTRDAAKYMDVMKLMFEDNRQRSKFDEWSRSADQKFEKIGSSISKEVLAGISKRSKHEAVKPSWERSPSSARQGSDRKQAGEHPTPAAGANSWPEVSAPNGQPPLVSEVECLNA